MSSSKEDKEKTFLEKNKDFVLKLRLVGVGGTPQIRRVRLSRIAADDEGEEGSAAGGISFDKLIKLAISQTFPGAPLQTDDYNVALTYYDVDNDCVTIASTEELVDAIEQYSDTEPPVLRLTTDVKRTKKSVSNKKKHNSNNRPVVSPVGRFADASPSAGGGPQVQIQNALESFVTVLASAVIALQEKVNLPPPPSPDVASSRSSSVNSSSTRTATDDNGAGDYAVAAAAAASSAPDSKKDAVVEDDEKIEATTATTTTSAATNSGNNGDEQKRRPFIHGRHTCDGCLCTPIVGTRYNAVNLPDYDLCANCYNNYKGTEIQFETAELDRDRPFQERWHRRRARWSGGRGHCASSGGARHQRRHNRRSKNNKGSGSGRFAVTTTVEPVPSRHPAGPAPSELDAALKEAIRRSLKEEADDNDADATTTTKKAAVVVVDEAKSPPTPPAVEEDEIEEERLVEKKETSTEQTVVVNDESDIIEDTKEECPSAKEMPSSDKEQHYEPTTSPWTGAANKETFSSAAAGSGDVAEALGQTLDECAKAIDGIMTELVRDENKSSDANVIVVDDDDDSVDGDDDDEDEKIVADDDGSVPSPPVEDEGEEMHNNDDGEEDVSAMTCSVPSVLVDSVKEEVDVAVIDEKTSPSPDVLANEVDDTTDTAAEDEESDNAGGATILDSVDPTDEGDVNEDEDASNASGESDEWQVVKEDGEITTNDEIQARAFQMVGSSLFDSQMSTGTDGGAEASSAPTEISDPPSSVPSNITSIVGDDARSSATPAVAALARWAPQLAQLRELGFDNESECVDALEMLFAANVGVDASDEEVTVTQVVEELLKDSN